MYLASGQLGKGCTLWINRLKTRAFCSDADSLWECEFHRKADEFQAVLSAEFLLMIPLFTISMRVMCWLSAFVAVPGRHIFHTYTAEQFMEKAGFLL